MILAFGAASHSIPCSFRCTCDSVKKSVVCKDINAMSLDSVLQSVPEDTHTLQIVHSTSSESWLDSKQGPQGVEFGYYGGERLLLQVLKVEHSDLHSLNAASLAKIPNLRALHLDHNKLEDIPVGVFTELTNLEVLELGHNKIAYVNGSLFRPLENLRVLNLAHNNLTSFPSSVLQELDSLVELDLSYNLLQSLPTFSSAHQLQSLSLAGNLLWMAPEGVFHNMSSLRTLNLASNPWHCTCALEWLQTAILDLAHKVEFVDKNAIVCHEPPELKSKRLTSVSSAKLRCDLPEFDIGFEDQSILYLHSHTLHCNATGDPAPLVYWLTPHGIMAHPDYVPYIPHESKNIHSKLQYAGQPTHIEASMLAHRNGSLQFRNFRNFYAGDYTCVAQNPGGFVNTTFHIKTATIINQLETTCLMYGAIATAGFLILSIVLSSVRLCIVHVCFKKKFKHLPGGITMEITDKEEEDLAQLSPYLFRWTPYKFDHGGNNDPSPDASPMKCVTPAEADEAEENFSAMSLGILETLEDVRASLSEGMGRQVDRLRNRAHIVRQSSSRYVHSIRASSSNYMNTLRESSSRKLGSIRETSSRKVRSFRESSSQAAHRVRAGVVLGMESVKYHVQSMKEFCGSGELSHTISTVSVSTDVDSRERSEVVRTITFV